MNEKNEAKEVNIKTEDLKNDKSINKKSQIIGENNDNKDKNQVSILSFIRDMFIVIVLVLLVNQFVMIRTYVSGPSMRATLEHGDNIIVNRLIYKFQDPERFDIISFEYINRSGYTQETTYYVKRIIALPGETIQINDAGEIFINGELLEENFGIETILNAGRAINPVTLNDNEYFVLGDNRNHSEDSRKEHVGNIHHSQIVGRLAVRIWPLQKMGQVK
jgi:signal peptidase I, bacterial type